MVSGHHWTKLGPDRWGLIKNNGSVTKPVAVLVKHHENLWWWYVVNKTLQGEAGSRVRAVEHCERQIRAILFGG